MSDTGIFEASRVAKGLQLNGKVQSLQKALHPAHARAQIQSLRKGSGSRFTCSCGFEEAKPPSGNASMAACKGKRRKRRANAWNRQSKEKELDTMNG